MNKEIHFEPYAVEKYVRVTNEVANDINKIAVSFDNDDHPNSSNLMRKQMEQVCAIQEDLENPDWDTEKLINNAKVLKNAINVLTEYEEYSMQIPEQINKLQGLYDCWQRLFGITFDDKKEA